MASFSIRQARIGDEDAIYALLYGLAAYEKLLWRFYVTREDVVVPPFSQEVAISNAPQSENGAFVIPAIAAGGDDE